MYSITTTITESDIERVAVGDLISFTGHIYCGRDAVLPKIVRLYYDGKLNDYGIDLAGSLIFHTAVSPAGIGPTSSNKLEIENSIAPLSEAGVKIHLGKGAISKATIDSLNLHKAIYAVIPPVSALLQSIILETKVVAFPQEGMEALHRLKVDGIRMIVAAAHGQAIYKV